MTTEIQRFSDDNLAEQAPLKQDENESTNRNGNSNNSKDDINTDKTKLDVTSPKQAFANNDAAASKRIHEQKILVHKNSKGTESDNDESINIPMSPEKHKKLGEFIKSIIYGGLDGIITTFSIVAAVQGASVKPVIVLIFGLANVFADGFSMGLGDYLSEKAEMDFAISEREREKWEFENFQEGEIDEMIQIYEKKGIKREDAEIILRTMAKYPDFFIDHMMIQELDISPVDEGESPVKNGLVTMLSFYIFGCIPLLSYIIFLPVNLDRDDLFIIACCLTVTTLFVLGLVKGKLTDSNMLASALLITVNGTTAAALSYGIGALLSYLTDSRGNV